MPGDTGFRDRWLVLFIAGIATASLSCSAKRAGVGEQSVQNNSPPVERKQPEPVRALIHRRDNSDVALMGAAFLDAMENAARKVSPDAQDPVLLSSRDDLKLEEEKSLVVWNSRLEKKPRQPEQWKWDPKDFDFLINWDVNSKEEPKYLMFDPLKITVSEIWKVNKVSDPAVTKSWTYSVTLNGGAEIPAYEKTAAEQVEKVVAPVRGPVLRQITEFNRANRSSGTNAK